MSDDGVNVGRRRFLTAATSVVGGVGAVGVAVPFVKSWNPSAKAKAAGAPVKFNVSKMEPGQMVTVEWRGKPVYVVRRSEEVLQNLEKVTPLLRDPNSEESIQPPYVNPQNRAIKAHLLVMVGLCTHLGCAPMFRPEVGATDLGGDEWFGGFFCPCHGSKYDMAGRVYTGVPAPTNMDVPPYSYEGDDIIVIGVDQEGSA
ncbi:Ubiquinol-cytochrome c reductase iron-sulfur subunit [Microbulbifer aggregans]|uniref:Ubiquinol-cytochrome c reductase iron-sulfur subunit n=1 Tax=Microbulbifer aggregans TaxID=1769779 RepID=A0A1C9WC72_9GAMM|nr:ubiquinol-cytochrome c reductase iron-sulfur subunit [Microbulbifer aggregans]AOS98759.1 Ubiquinol-cytochrome c reductase iron-sulfur subunit [Microbulbifer aggregans]